MNGRGAGLLARLRPPPLLVVALITGLALVVLIPVAVSSTPAMIGVFFALVLFLALILLGFGHTAEFFVILGVCHGADDQPPPRPSRFITVADAAFAVGFALMLPDLMRRPLQLPSIFVFGVAGVLIVALFSSMLADEPVGSLNFLARLLVGAFGLSTLIIWWNPDRKRVVMIACAYVLGNVISVGYALIKNEAARDGRRAGLAEHPNVYGLCAMLAATLVPFIVTQFPRSWRWIPAGAGVVCLYGVWSSGSRAALAVLIGVAVIYPVLARSVSPRSACSGCRRLLDLLDPLLGETSSGNALGRLLGAGSASLSDQAREQLLKMPSTGSGTVRSSAMAWPGSSKPTSSTSRSPLPWVSSGSRSMSWCSGPPSIPSRCSLLRSACWRSPPWRT